MFEYREVIRCKDCGKIYEKGWTPHICGKCGSELYNDENLLYCSKSEYDWKDIIDGYFERHLLIGGEKIIAKPTLRGWRVKSGAPL